MRKAILAGLAITVVSLAAAPAASAVTIRNCGNYGVPEEAKPDRDGTLKPRWTRERISGAGIFNVTAANTMCRTARRLVRRSHPAEHGESGWQWRGWACDHLTELYEFSESECVKGARAVRWESGA